MKTNTQPISASETRDEEMSGEIMESVKSNVGNETEEQYSFPCTIVQKTCWLFEQTAPGSAMNNVAVRFALHGPLDVKLLEEALLRIVVRHEVMRTRFVMYGGEPMQIVEATPRFLLKYSDLRGLQEADRQAEADRLSIEEARIGFDIATGPLFRGQLLQTGSEDFLLLLTMHHIISDGWSVGIVTEEMGAIYQGLVERKEADVPKLAIQYADYACWQQEWVESGSLKTELAYWKTKLDGFTPLQIQTDFERPVNPANLGEIRSIVLPRILTDRMKEVSEREGCTLFITMLSAFLVVMQRESGQTDLVLRSPAAGRGRMELEPLIGWFVNPLVLRTQVDPAMKFKELLKAVQETVLEAFEHQDVPFERVMEVVKAKPTAQRQPPLQVNFIMQRDFVKPWKRSGLEMTAIPSKSAGVFVDLNFFLVEREDGWRASVDVSKEVFKPETGEAMLLAFRTALEDIGKKENPVLSEIDVPLQKRVASYDQATAASAIPSAHISPVNERERAIVEIWEQLLDVSPISVDSNFFDLGGHSILATRLTSEIHKKFNQEINLAQLFEDPTPAAMARLVDAPGQSKTNESFVQVIAGNSRPPFFMIDGDHWFRPFALNSGEDQPFIGIPLHAIGRPNTEQERLTVAAKVAEMMMKAYPKEKFLMGGWCDAGVTAFAVAREIENRGGTIGAVFLFDAMNPEYYHGLQSVAASTSRRITHVQQVFKSKNSGGFMSSLSKAARELKEGLRRGVDRLPSLFKSDYDHGQASFPVVLLRPSTLGVGDPELGWGRLCPKQLTVIEVPGDHASIFREPNVQKLGKLHRQALDSIIASLS